MYNPSKRGILEINETGIELAAQRWQELSLFMTMMTILQGGGGLMHNPLPYLGLSDFYPTLHGIVQVEMIRLQAEDIVGTRSGTHRV